MLYMNIGLRYVTTSHHGDIFVLRSYSTLNKDRCLHVNIVTRLNGTVDGVFDWILDLFTTLTHDSYLHLILAS
jgi:hypothetical protein